MRGSLRKLEEKEMHSQVGLAIMEAEINCKCAKFLMAKNCPGGALGSFKLELNDKCGWDYGLRNW